MIWEYLLLAAILTIQAILAFIPSFGKIVDKRRKGWNFFTDRGKTFVILSIFAIMLFIMQFYLQKGKEYKTEVKNENESKIKDSLNDIKLRENTKELLETISDELGRYKLALDTANKKIITLLKDSIKQTTINNYGKDPVFTLCTTKGIILKNDKDDLWTIKLNFCPENSPNAVSATCTILEFINGRVTILAYPSPIYKNSSELIGSNLGHTVGLWMKTNSFPLSNTIFFYFKGNYSSLDLKKKFSIDRFYAYSINSGTYGTPEPDIEEQLRNHLIKKNNSFLMT